MDNSFVLELIKIAKTKTKLLPHQERVVERLKRPSTTGLVVAHGLGRGKTLSSIAAQEALGLDADVVVPAALQANYLKEVDKHTENSKLRRNLVSQQRVSRASQELRNRMLIVDEAHKARETGSKLKSELKRNDAQKRMLLTASPFYNHPADLAPLVNLASGERVFPETRGEFNKEYITRQRIRPGIIGFLRGIKSGTKETINPAKVEELKNIYNTYVDYEPGASDEFPDVTEETVEVPMTKRQGKIYDALLGAAPPWVAYKVRNGLPPNKQEVGELNAFLSAARQVSNTTKAYDAKNAPEAPKIQMAVNSLQEMLNENPRSKAVVYSNFLESGIEPYANELSRRGIPFGQFTGKQKQKERDQMVRDYNEGKLKALLISSAGGEGLDLKGTRLMQVLDPHWNHEKLRQVKGRGIRYKSHAGLPEDERNVKIENYLAVRPNTVINRILSKVIPTTSSDKYMKSMADDKQNLVEQFTDILESNR